MMSSTNRAGSSPVQGRSALVDLGRVLATLMILHFHLMSSGFCNSGGFGAFAQLLFESLAGAAIAFFFIFAGYFVRSRQSWRGVLFKALALLVPCLFWNSLCAFGLRDEVSLGRIVGIGREMVPADYPLWFCNALMVMILLSPLLQRALLPCILGCAVLVYFGNSWHCEWMKVFPFLSPSGLLYYLVGMLLGRVSLNALEGLFLRWWFACAFVPVFVLARTSEWVLLNGCCTIWLKMAVMAFGILLLAAWTARLLPRVSARVAAWAPACFLLYAFHAPACLFSGGLMLRFWPEAGHSAMASQSLALFVTAFCMLLYTALKRWSPKLLPVIAHDGKLPFVGKLSRGGSGGA